MNGGEAITSRHIILIIISRALKTSHMRACASITCDDRALSLCHESPNDPFVKRHKKSLMALLRLYAAAASMTFIESPKRPL